MSAAARTLSLIDLCDLSEDAAHKMLCEMRWEDADGACSATIWMGMRIASGRNVPERLFVASS
jgi:hypothetical protein